VDKSRVAPLETRARQADDFPDPHSTLTRALPRARGIATSGESIVTTDPASIFALAVVTGFASFWMLLFVWHKGDMVMRNLDAHDVAALRHEALRMVVSLSLVCSLIALFATQLPQDRQLWLSGGASGLWAGCLHMFWLSANWWRGRTLWKVE
jgi:hypothetical protein